MYSHCQICASWCSLGESINRKTVNWDEQIETKLPTLIDEFIFLNEEKSVSKTLDELLAFSAHASESVASCTVDIDSEIYRFKCNQC